MVTRAYSRPSQSTRCVTRSQKHECRRKASEMSALWIASLSRALTKVGWAVNEQTPLLSPDVPVNLSNCDLEPIHIPSSIQPHGLLLAARSSDLQVVYTSVNSDDFLGVPPAFVLQHTLGELLGKEAVASIQNALRHEQYLPNNVLVLNFAIGGSARFDVVAHHSGGLLCVELEPSSEEAGPDSLPTQMEGAIRELGRPKTVDGLCHVVAPLIRTLTGYDRVMVYRFDRDGNGEIVAEDKAPEMEPFLGLHYPATDIPRQARKLYLHQRVRTIVDVNYQPVPLAANPGLARGEPLDMTYCGLRSVSPIHIEYLQNMGVGATFGVSLIHENELWGMLICHHRTRKHLSPAIRSFCDLLGQTTSLLIGVTQQAHDSLQRLERKSLLEGIRQSIEADGSLWTALTRNAKDILALVGADGALFKLGEETELIGRTPPLTESIALMSSVQSSFGGGISSTDESGSLSSDFVPLTALASGALVAPLRESGDGIMWVRGEVAETVHWAGKPEASKEITGEGSVRLSPRKSFAAWVEVQRGRSLPWLPVDREAAVGLQSIISDRSLVDRLFLEQLLREKRIEALSHMAGGLAHEINNPLAIIHGTASNLQDSASGESPLAAVDVRKASKTIVETTDRAMSILRGLRGFAREAANDPMEWASIHDIAEQSVELQQARFESHNVKLQLTMEQNLPLILCREVQVGQILTNLLNNAFDAITQHSCEERWTSVKAQSSDGQLQIDVVDSGPGIDDESRANLMQPFFSTKTRGLGMGIGLSLSRAIAQDHGGSLTLRSNTEHTCFRLTLPIHIDEVTNRTKMSLGALSS